MDTPDSRLDAICERQHALVSFMQLLDIGFTRSQIRRRVESKRLSRYRHHVYMVRGAPVTSHQPIMAAVLASGPTAHASHATAAWLFGLPLPGVGAANLPLEVTVVLERCPQIDGVRMHRSGLLIARDVTNVSGIPVTTPERTIVELSGRLSVADLGRVTDEALRRRITTYGRVRQAGERLGRAPGRSPKRLGEMLMRRLPGVDERESPLEDFVYEAIRRFGLPLPVCQYPVTVNGARFRVDMCYPESSLSVEADGFTFHSGRSQFDSDRLRGNEVALAGLRPLRFTSAFTDWQIASQVARALGRDVPARPHEELTFEAWLAQRCV